MFANVGHFVFFEHTFLVNTPAKIKKTPGNFHTEWEQRTFICGFKFNIAQLHLLLDVTHTIYTVGSAYSPPYAEL